jgi:hypothetical protein
MMTPINASNRRYQTGAYEILAPLGVGSMEEVYRVSDGPRFLQIKRQSISASP